MNLYLYRFFMETMALSYRMGIMALSYRIGILHGT